MPSTAVYTNVVKTTTTNVVTYLLTYLSYVAGVQSIDGADVDGDTGT